MHLDKLYLLRTFCFDQSVLSIEQIAVSIKLRTTVVKEDRLYDLSAQHFSECVGSVFSILTEWIIA